MKTICSSFHFELSQKLKQINIIFLNMKREAVACFSRDTKIQNCHLKKKTYALKQMRDSNLQAIYYQARPLRLGLIVLKLYVFTKKIGQETYFFCCKKKPL